MFGYIFESNRLGFREWRNEDIVPFSKMNKDLDVMEFFPKPLSRKETALFVERIQKMFCRSGFGLYAVDKLRSSKFIGFIGFSQATFKSDFTPCIEIAWRLEKQEWNNGYATEGAKECLNFGFQKLKFKQVFSLTAKMNSKSERIMKKIGMKKVKEFEHPRISPQSKLRVHVLYKKDGI